jgi:beta-galactosidase
MIAEVVKDGEIIDRDSVNFGFRKVRIDPESGLYINGKHYLIKGLCGHADCGLMGKAVPDNIHRYKVQLMKEMGANGYRCSHYPQAEALMDELDKAGFIVMDEIRWFESTDEGIDQLETLIKRDRNHPSVVFWSVGNEEPYHATEQGRNICQTLMAKAKKLDDSRFIMTAVDKPTTSKVYDLNDVIGINYNLKFYDDIHKQYPDKGVFASECCASGTTRGQYLGDDPARGYVSSYDKDMNEWFLGREKTWKFLMARPWVLGCYQWIAFEHRGEAVWPRLCSQSGAIDLFMQKKDAFYQNKSHFSDEPTVHLLPHWNWQGLEGESVRVVAYTNCEELELFLNGESLGRKAIEKYGHGEWQVPYALGTLEVKAYVDGKTVATDKQMTTGKPCRLVLTQDTLDVRANDQDIALFTCSVVDENGLTVPDANIPTVSFSTSGDCQIYSTGSDISDHGYLLCPDRRMREGRITVAVKLGGNPNGMKIYAKAEGLGSAVATVITK